jgi:hypothetical protein
MIIAINGYAGAGKDEIGNLIVKHAPQFKVKKFAGKLKEIATILTGIPSHYFESSTFKQSKLGGWDMSVRELLQRLGTEAIRDGLHPNAWINALMADYMRGDDWVITDMRFQNEYDTICSYGGYTIQVYRAGVRPPNNHSSEAGITKGCFDYIIDNSGTLEQLEEEVKRIVSDILEKEKRR